MSKFFIGVIVFVVVLGGAGLYIWKTGLILNLTPVTPTPTPTAGTSLTYASSTFSIKYPKDFTADEQYAYQGVPNKPIAGVKFIIPLTMTTGTNLSSDSGVSVESLPRAKKCTGDIYLFDNVKPTDLTVGSTTYSVASTSGAGAGNFYEEMVHAIPASSPCIAVRYFIHSGNIGNYPQAGEPGAVREFDRAALLTAFDKIRDSLVLQ